jgi:sorting nexin-29
LIVQIWRLEKIPEEWKLGIIHPIYKKGDKMQCDNYRGITLLNVAYKIFTPLIHKRLSEKAEGKIGDYQMGFRANSSTIDNIHIIRQIFEKCCEFGIELHNIFVDFKMAFDNLNRQSIFDCLSVLATPQKLIRLIKTTMEASIARVKIEVTCLTPLKCKME